MCALIREQGIRLVHQPTPVSPKAPSFLSGFGIPVVIGPMNWWDAITPAFRNNESLSHASLLQVAAVAANLITTYSG